jgi:hypothetical protein
LFTAGFIFTGVIFMILLILLSIYFVTNFQVDKGLYLIFLIIFLLLLLTVYAIKSKIVKR